MYMPSFIWEVSHGLPLLGFEEGRGLRSIGFQRIRKLMVRLLVAEVN